MRRYSSPPVVTSPDRSGVIAFVPPRYGGDVVGGAEAVLGEWARGFASRGWEIEVLTTCAKDHYTWANEYPAGVSAEDGLTVRRFPTVLDTPGRHRQVLGDRMLAGEHLSIPEQQLWVNDSLRVPELWHHVLDHGSDYRAIILGPYMFWTTFAVAQIHPERTFLHPSLHREPAATLDIYKPIFEGSRGVFFNVDPEQEYAASLFHLPPRQAVIGNGIHLPETYDPEGFRARHGIDGDFVYYAGRREWAKGWTDLVAAFTEAVDQRGVDLRLVTSGASEPGVIADAISDRVIDLGFLPGNERDDAMAAAAAYVQPSALESFSRTVAEALSAGTPVIANGESEVVAWHLERSGAGLRYHGHAELVEALTLLDADPAAVRALASGGRRYIEENYEFDLVLDRFEGYISEWSEAP